MLKAVCMFVGLDHSCFPVVVWGIVLSSSACVRMCISWNNVPLSFPHLCRRRCWKCGTRLLFECVCAGADCVHLPLQTGITNTETERRCSSSRVPCVFYPDKVVLDWNFYNKTVRDIHANLLVFLHLSPSFFSSPSLAPHFLPPSLPSLAHIRSTHLSFLLSAFLLLDSQLLKSTYCSSPINQEIMIVLKAFWIHFHK